jgi:3'(2'),5'-bisphosphate nucleotidase
MANPGAKQRGKVEGVEGKHRHLSSIRKAKLVPARIRIRAPEQHCNTCAELSSKRNPGFGRRRAQSTEKFIGASIAAAPASRPVIPMCKGQVNKSSWRGEFDWVLVQACQKGLGSRRDAGKWSLRQKPSGIFVKDIENNKTQAIDRDAIADIFAEIAIEAAVAVMAVYAGDIMARRKPDGSPVCDADEAAEAIILKRLAMRLPNFPVLAEEAASRGEKTVLQAAFILVDPVDGTREFLSRNGEFTINIGLIADAAPVAGVVYAPALEQIWIGGVAASTCTIVPGAPLPPPEMRRRIHVRQAPGQGLTALVSRSHAKPETEAFLAKRCVRERREAGSSLKFCLVAEGHADVYPRFGQTMEWDTAAGDAVLRAAGGIVVDGAGRPLRYGKAEAEFRNPPFVAWGDPKAAIF